MAKKPFKEDVSQVTDRDEVKDEFDPSDPNDEVLEEAAEKDPIGGAAEPDRKKRKQVSGNNGP